MHNTPLQLFYQRCLSITISGLKDEISDVFSTGETLALILFAIFREQIITSTGNPALSSIQLSSAVESTMPLTHEVIDVCKLSRKGAKTIKLADGMKVLNVEGSPMNIYTGPVGLFRL